ncbi:beta/gamma crystallin [Thermosporothrix hazakensis]|uniref:Beta/gamma crystallin n=1 Tax=Thermosporothrix hazakensis TaxID=644383 RepID=A0A326TXF5_THEHA|nr:beta/gamma crystallin [Thermosporothrix hazakensis]
MQPYTNRVYNCVYPNEYLVFFNAGPLVCFANNGELDVHLYNVYQVDSGNNSGEFNFCHTPYRPDAVCGTIRFASYTTYYPPTGLYWNVLKDHREIRDKELNNSIFLSGELQYVFQMR